MSANPYVIGVDIGGSHVLSGAVSLHTGRLLENTLCELKIDNQGSRTTILNEWASTINHTLSGLSGKEVIGIGFAMPGAFNYKTGVALFEGNKKYESLYNCDVPQSLTPLLNVEGLEMRFLNDATSFAVGEAWKGEAAGKQRAISITLGTGFGSAFVEDGIPVTHGDAVPKHGCLWHLPFLEGIGDDYFSTRWFINRYQKFTGNRIAGAKDVFDLSETGDQLALQLFFEFGTNMAIFIAPWIRKFNPDVLVMGGNISKAWCLFEDAFNRQLIQEQLSVEVRVSQLKEHAALLGSARLFEASAWDRIKPVLTEF